VLKHTSLSSALYYENYTLRKTKEEGDAEIFLIGKARDARMRERTYVRDRLSKEQQRRQTKKDQVSLGL